MRASSAVVVAGLIALGSSTACLPKELASERLTATKACALSAPIYRAQVGAPKTCRFEGATDSVGATCIRGTATSSRGAGPIDARVNLSQFFGKPWRATNLYVHNGDADPRCDGGTPIAE